MKDKMKHSYKEKRIGHESKVKMVKPEYETKTMPVEANYGQKMVDNKFMHASNTFKPKGRKK